jgi:lipoprotein-releasing system permease protein
MVISPSGTDALFVRGVDLERERDVTDIADYIKPSGFRFRARRAEIGEIVIGTEVAYSLKVATGDTLLLAKAEVSDRSPFGIIPSFRRFVVAGFFDSGMYEYDASLAFVRLEDAQGPDGETGSLDLTRE